MGQGIAAQPLTSDKASARAGRNLERSKKVAFWLQAIGKQVPGKMLHSDVQQFS